MVDGFNRLDTTDEIINTNEINKVHILIWMIPTML